MKEQRSKGRKRGRPRKDASKPRRPQTSRNYNVIDLDASSSEAPTNKAISLLNTTDESIINIAKTSRNYAGTKQLCIKLPDLANVPGALTAEHVAYLSARRFRAEEQAAKVERERLKQKQKRKRKKTKPKVISISSDSTEADWLPLSQRRLPKRSKNDSSESREKPRDAKNKTDRRELPLSFGQKASSEMTARRTRRNNVFNEKSVSTCGLISSADRVSTKTEQKLCDRRRLRNSRKRRAGDSDSLIEKRRKQRLIQDYINGKMGLPGRLDMDQADFVSSNDVACGEKLMAAVDDFAGKASIAPVNEFVALVNEIIAPVDERITTDHRIADKAFVANETEKASAIDEEGKISAINRIGFDTSAVNNADKAFYFSPMVNGDLRNVDFSSFQPFLECENDIKMICLETNENEQLTLFSAPNNNANHALDKDPSSLDSIAKAIDNDLAGGNQPIGLPIGGIDNAEMMGQLPDPSMFSNEGNQPGIVERRPEASSKIHDTFDTSRTNGELAPILDNGNESFESNVNRKRLAIIEDDILPRGTIDIPSLSWQTIRANRKRKKFNRSVAGTPASSGNDNQNLNDSIAITLSNDEKLNTVNECEIETLLNENCANNHTGAAAKDGQICEDVLNNNRGMTKPVTLQIDDGLSNEFNALKCLVDMTPDALDKAITDGVTVSDFDSFDEQKINAALEEFTAAIAENISKSNTARETVNNGEAKPVGTLTIQNLNKFNSRTGLVETVNKSTNLKSRETIDTDASSRESARLRKRTWTTANGEKPASSPAKSGTIKLNRRNWSTGSQNSREKSREVEQPIDHNAESEKSVAKVAKNEDKKNYKETPDTAETVPVIVEISRTLVSPIRDVQGCGNEIDKFLPRFGSSSLQNVATTTPTNDVEPVVVGATDESSGSSSSSSSSSSRSTSRSTSSSSDEDEDSSDESDDEDISNEVEITGECEAVVTKNSEAPCQSDSGFKRSTLTTRQTGEEKTLALFGAEPESVAAEKSGSLIDGCNDTEKSEDDNSDCISLYTESLCMSRCASPEHQVSAKRPVSPQKQQKRGNVRSRLGPRVAQNQPNTTTAATENSKHTVRTPQTATSKILGCESAANSEVAVEPAPNKSQGRLAASNVIQVCPEAIAPVITDPSVVCCRKIEQLFRGHCWSWLKYDTCRNFPMCRYLHAVHPQLQYQVMGMSNTRAIILYAISKEYRHFIEIVYEYIVPLMSVRQIVQFGIDVHGSRTVKHDLFKKIIEALKMHNLTLVEVVGLFDSMLSVNDVEPAMVIIESFYNMADPGTYWETLKKLMMKFADAKLPINVVTAVLNECVNIYRNKMHVDDVHDNLVAKLTNDTRLALGGDLLKTFYDLRYAHAAVQTDDRPEEAAKKSNWTCSIASPDSSRDSVDFPLAALLADRPSTSSSAPTVQPQDTRKTSKPSSDSQSGEASTSGSESYILKHLDKLAPPKSAYNLWKFHLDLQGVQQGLLHHDYDHVINILTELQKDPNRLPHIAGFYNILCKEIMSSRHHLEEIVRRTVQCGATNELRRFVYDLGVYVLTTLADTGAWVLAYQLLKTFKVYGQYNTCAFTLLSAEIYIANHRPLKALAILKQTRLIFTNTRNWNQMWCPNDEPLRVSVIELLLSSLCDEYAEHALALLEFILGDQCSSFKPINISRCIDRVASVLLKNDLTNAVVDLGRLIVQNNLLVSSRIFRALINRIIHSDQFLAKQLHRYATWLGIYNMPKISNITHMVVNIDWTEEEMYLMFSSLLHDLYINIGHAIGRLRPRQLAVYLILEQLPTERQLLRDLSGPPLTNSEIRKRRAVVKSVFERFDPKIKVIQRLQGKLCKVQSESLVNYLKAGHFKC